MAPQAMSRREAAMRDISLSGVVAWPIAALVALKMTTAVPQRNKPAASIGMRPAPEANGIRSSAQPLKAVASMTLPKPKRR